MLPDDPYLKQLWIDTTFVVTFESEPSGAEVSVKGYLAHDAEWIPLGRTPLENVRVPYAHVRTRLTKPGFTPLEASLSSFKVKYTLDPEGATPSGMVRAQAGTASVGGTILPVDDFWIDRLEVTNQEFKTFVDRGGYEKPEYWKEPFVENGRTLTFAEAMARFRDATGRVGPSTWELGTYPEGQANLPVTGVSWYEAAAYAAYAGKVLPTAYHWTRAAGARGGFTENFSEILYVSNFGGKGLAPGGTHRGVSAAGTYDMAGNAKEWTASGVDEKRLILGGGFNEPSYMFNDLDGQPPFDRRAAYGFRCAKYITPPSAETVRPVVMRDAGSRAQRSGQRLGVPGLPGSVPLRCDAARGHGRVGRRRGRLAQGNRQLRRRVRQRTRARLPLPAEERGAALPDDRLLSGRRRSAPAIEPRLAPELRRLPHEERTRGALPDLQGHLRARTGSSDGCGGPA